MSAADTWWFQQRWSDFRRGDHTVRICWAPEGAARARLYDQGVARTVVGFEQALPFQVEMVHAAWSGEMVMSSRTYEFGPHEAENEIRLVRPGDLTWDHRVGELGLVYGDAECRLPSGPNTVVVFGQVLEGLDSLAAFCRRRRFEGAGTLTFETDGGRQ